MVMLQCGLCAICGKEELAEIGDVTKSLSVDHNHKTGKVRQLLCGNCNRGLGNFQDDTSLLERAISYLREG